MEEPEYAHDKRRSQYNSKLILRHLQQHCRPDTLRLIGITHMDIYVPILKYVFGLAQMEGQCAVISLHRLCPQFYDKPSDHNLFMSRAEKTALHELGHSFGLIHCRDRRCVMYPSTVIRDTDLKYPDFCPTCFELLRWYLSKNPVSSNP